MLEVEILGIITVGMNGDWGTAGLVRGAGPHGTPRFCGALAQADSAKPSFPTGPCCPVWRET